MTLDEFTALRNKYTLLKPSLFALAQPDASAKASDIAKVENEIGVALPKAFTGFLSRFGGGATGLVTIFSADETGTNYLPVKQAEASKYLPHNLLAFCDDYSGGIYAFQISAGEAGEQVYYWNLDGGVSKTDFNNVLEFLARYAYEAA